MKGAAWAAPVAAFSVGAPALAFSPSCTDDSLLDSQARARMLSGQIGGADLDVIAEVNGVHAQAFDPIADGADSISQDLKTNPLTVEALSAINLNLGGLSGALTTILDFATAQDAGVLNEYAYANENAQSANNPDAPEVGGAGAVGNDGTIALSVDDPNPPALGTINLYSILEQA
ncbi:MAG: choice-of-anchor G family protein, partial [Brachybacterium tyrofermentans]